MILLDEMSESCDSGKQKYLCLFAWLSVFYYFLPVKILSNDYLGELIIS